MKVVHVQYTVQESYADKNKENIAAVMAELRAAGSKGVRYSSFIHDDGKTFSHWAITKTEDNSAISGLESFQKFQTELKASAPEKPPQVTNLSMVGSSIDFF